MSAVGSRSIATSKFAERLCPSGGAFETAWKHKREGEAHANVLISKQHVNGALSNSRLSGELPCTLGDCNR